MFRYTTMVRYTLTGRKDWPVEPQLIADDEEAIHYPEKKHKYSEAETPDLVISISIFPKRDGVEVLWVMRDHSTLTAALPSP